MKQSSLKNTLEVNNNELSSNDKEQLVERKPIEDTPFTAIKYDGKWFLTMGKYRLTDPVDSYEQIQEDAQRADWTRVIQIMQLIIDENKTQWMKEVATELNKKYQFTTKQQ